MIYVGIDDTDMPGTPGTNQLARALIAHVTGHYRCRLVLRHQLLDDPRVPYTSKNGSASLQFEPVSNAAMPLSELIAALRTRMQAWYIPGSDPGLCVTPHVPEDVIAWGQRCQQQLVTRTDAEALAKRHELHLEGLGGTSGGMIGALAAVGLAASRNDGRVVVHGDWPDDLSGRTPIGKLYERGILVREFGRGATVTAGQIDVGKRLRPNLRNGQIVLFVEQTEIADDWRAVRLT
jgi:hypothetical protein